MDIETLHKYFRKTGDPDAFRQLFHQIGPKVWARILSKVDAEDAPDCYQEVFRKLLERLPRNPPIDNLVKFTLGLTRNVIADYHSKKHKEAHIDVDINDNLITSEQQSSTTEARLVLQSLLNSSQLPQKTTQVLVMRHIYGMSYQEIGDELNMSSDSARVRQARALKSLRDLVNQKLGKKTK